MTTLEAQEEPRVSSVKQSGFDVVMLTTVHSAVDSRIFHREAKTLAAHGLSVCIIGPHVRPETLSNVRIEPLPKATGRRQRFLQGWSLFKKARRVGGKLFIFHDPELLIIALLFRACGYKIVYDCHENVPAQMLQKRWMPVWVRWLMSPLVGFLESTISRVISGVITVNESLRKRFPKNRSIIVRNLPTREVLDVLTGGPPISERQPIVLYTGGLAQMRGIQELVRAFAGVKTPGAQLWLIGDFSDQKFKQEILSNLPANVKWLGAKKFEDVTQTYRLAQLGTMLYHPTPNHRNAMPVKMFEYLGAGLPILASDLPEYGEFLNECAIQVNPFDVEAIRKSIDCLLMDPEKLDDMSAAAKRNLRRLSWDEDGRKLTDFCSSLIRT